MAKFLKDQGADFIKEYDQLSRESYFALAEEAKRQGLPLAGHVPIVVTAAEASDAGQRSLEHNYGVLSGCSSREAEVMQKERELYGPGKGAMRGLLTPDDVKRSPARTQEVQKLFAKFVKSSTFVDHPCSGREAAACSNGAGRQVFLARPERYRIRRRGRPGRRSGGRGSSKAHVHYTAVW